MDLLGGATALTNAARMLVDGAKNARQGAPELADELFRMAKSEMRAGADQVELLGNPSFERMAADIVAQADAVQVGRSVGAAIMASTEGAGWLFSRASRVA